MYIIVRGHEVLAAHDDYEVISEYLLSQDNEDMKLLKIKKKKSKELEKIADFSDIYLVRYGDFYVPYEQYVALKDLNSQREYDLKYCKDVLFRLLEEENDFRKKDISAIKKTIQLVLSQVESLDDNNHSELEKIRKDVNELKPKEEF